MNFQSEVDNDWFLKVFCLQILRTIIGEIYYIIHTILKVYINGLSSFDEILVTCEHLWNDIDQTTHTIVTDQEKCIKN